MTRLLAVLCAAPLLAAAAPPPSPYAARLGDYRTDRACTGARFEAVLDQVDVALSAYHLEDPANVRASVVDGRMAAAQLDGLATVAAAKGCKVQALESWRFVIRFFDGPAFADLQQRAVAGLRSLHAPPPG